jgi:hypothetical protein
MTEQERRRYHTFADNGGALAAPVRLSTGAYAPDQDTSAKAIRFIRTHAANDADLLIDILGLIDE